tara:strand:+ start:476 stop:784 length:309 start_codon:yes stop_codon:yes gene_type:complete
MQPQLEDAIISLAPNTAFSLNSNVIVAWDMSEVRSNITQPTDAELATELARLQTVYTSQAYARSRKAAYDLLNQDEMRYDDLTNSTTTWPDAIAAIKAEFPK